MRGVLTYFIKGNEQEKKTNEKDDRQDQENERKVTPPKVSKRGRAIMNDKKRMVRDVVLAYCMMTALLPVVTAAYEVLAVDHECLSRNGRASSAQSYLPDLTGQPSTIQCWMFIGIVGFIANTAKPPSYGGGLPGCPDFCPLTTPYLLKC